MSNQPLTPRQKLELHLDKLPGRRLLRIMVLTNERGEVDEFYVAEEGKRPPLQTVQQQNLTKQN